MTKTDIQPFEVAVEGGTLTGLWARADLAGERPLILAIHGGTYTAQYFHVPGHSLLERAVDQGFDIIAIDRPGYGGSTALENAPDLIQKNADYLTPRVPALLSAFGRVSAPIFIIGHSIGGAITISMAAAQPSWLTGIAVSGVGLKTPPESAMAYAQFPDVYFVDLPTPMKDQLMFGPPETLHAGMPQASHGANTHCPLNELKDITGGWQDRLRALCPKVTVPVQTKQGQHEALWLTEGTLVQDFGACFTAAPRVEVAMVPEAGHCIDYHKAGAAFQDAQLAFARATMPVPAT